MAESDVAGVGLQCRDCGYDLRGLTDDTVCPECGLAVAESKRSDLLVDASPAWLQGLRWGFNVHAVGVLISLAYLTFLDVYPDWYWDSHANYALTLLAFGVPTHLVQGLGYWLMTSPPPRRVPFDEGSRRRVRWLGLAESGFGLFVNAGFALVMLWSGSWISLSGYWVWPTIPFIAMVMSAATWWYLLSYMRRLAWRGRAFRLKLAVGWLLLPLALAHALDLAELCVHFVAMYWSVGPMPYGLFWLFNLPQWLIWTVSGLYVLVVCSAFVRLLKRVKWQQRYTR